MKRLVSIFLTLALLMSLFSMVDVSAVSNQKYLVDLIEEGGAIIDNSDGKTYTPYQCDSAVDVGTPEGVVRIGDGTGTGYIDYTHGFRYHAASQGIARTITFIMPEGYNTLSGVVGVCYHVPGPDSGKDVYYREECYLAINVDGYPFYNSGFIKTKTGYPFKLRAKAGSKIDISVINLAENNSHCHVIFGDPKLTHEEYPDIELDFDKAVYREGETVNPVITGSESDEVVIKWYLDDEEVSGATDSYTIKKSDLGKSLKLVAYDNEGIIITSAETFLSRLTTVSIETETGEDVTSKEDYIDADLKIFGNEEFGGETQYDGLTEIRGRGNTSWVNHPKKSYKLKLDKKTNLCGMGKNKHWTLIACYWDESFLRNKMSYDLAGEMGLNYASSVWVDVYLNGKYHGMYLLCEHIRVDDTRVDIYDWEGTAEDVAEAIYEANSDKISDDGDFADYMNENMSWITTGTVTYEGNTYTVADYYEDEIPAIDGGYLLEMDTHRDEVSSVQTYSGLNINIKNPEFCISNTAMLNYVKDYLQAVENACISEDYTITYNGLAVRYTDLCDLDSMVKWWMVNEVFFNWDAGFNSNFMYKDHGTKLIFGPVWDMDITAGGYGTSYLYDQWQTWYYKRSSCMNLWFKEAVADPVFLSYAHDVYWQYRDKFEEMIAEDGYMEKSHELLYESGLKNTELWRWRKGYETDYQIMKEWLRNRLDWLDEQFATEESLIASMAAQTSAVDVTTYSSIEAYENSPDMELNIATKSGAEFLTNSSKASAKYIFQAPDSLVNSVAISDANIVAVVREINGKNTATVNVTNGVAEFASIPSDAFDNQDHKNVILYTGYSAAGEVLGKVYATVSVVACEHPEIETVQGYAATCINTGLTDGSKCSVCDEILVAQEEIPATGHTKKTVKGYAATCTKEGRTDGVVCSVCGATITAQKTIAKKAHTAVELKAKAATCTKTGLTKGSKCSVCGKVLTAQKTVAKKAHTPVELKAKAATCTATGLTKGSKCSVCDTILTSQKTVAKKAHSYKTTTTKATLKKNGKIVKKCTVCGKVASTTTIYYAKTVKLSKVKFTYTGKTIKPTLVVKNSKGKTISSKYYTVTGTRSTKKIGKHKITLKFKGRYSGTKPLYYTINPKTVASLKLKAGESRMTVSYKKDSSVGGYEIMYATNKSFKKAKTTKATSAKKTIKKLTSKKTYYVKVRAYKKVSGKTYYGAYCKAKTIKVK